MKSPKTLTIFTPAYNRAHTIERTFQSLCRQTNKDFEWLIIDDGSSDNTKELILSKIIKDTLSFPPLNKESNENIETYFEGNCKDGFLIRYFYQQNQGMHGAHNTAYKHINTELNTCIDSDDYMPDDAVDIIVNLWKERGNNKYAGIVGLDYADKGGIIGTEFPQDMKETTLNGFYLQGGRGDKKLVYRTDVIKKYPEYPTFKGERYFSLGYKYLLIDQDYLLLTINKPLVIVDYQLDGSSFNMYRQYWTNPNGFIFLRKEHMQYQTLLRNKYRSCVHYISHCIRAGRIKEFLSNPCPILSFLAIIPGTFLYFFTKYKVYNHKMMNIKN